MLWIFLPSEYNVQIATLFSLYAVFCCSNPTDFIIFWFREDLKILAKCISKFDGWIANGNSGAVTNEKLMIKALPFPWKTKLLSVTYQIFDKN